MLVFVFILEKSNVCCVLVRAFDFYSFYSSCVCVSVCVFDVFFHSYLRCVLVLIFNFSSPFGRCTNFIIFPFIFHFLSIILVNSIYHLMLDRILYDLIHFRSGYVV